jgi:hypothetical protein
VGKVSRVRSQPPGEVDLVVSGRDLVFEIKRGVTGVRGVREGLLQLAYRVSEKQTASGLLVLLDSGVTFERLRAEWTRGTSILRPDLSKRLSLCVAAGDRFVGFPDEIDAKVQRRIAKYVEPIASAGSFRTSHGDGAFIVLKVLIHQWLTSGEAVTTNWLAETAGFSYPTVANALGGLGSLIERESNRRVRLRWFPREQFARLAAVSDRVRGTARFADLSAQPRPPEAHLRRLEKLRPPNIAIGGVLGAKHYHSHLDIVGVPRLDLSYHNPDNRFDVSFIENLDPALKRTEDPLQPATVVVHHVRHAKSLFSPRERGLMWADQVECLLDLHEAHLDAQATEFLKVLERDRPRVAA